jgi:hypothetical protein
LQGGRCLSPRWVRSPAGSGDRRRSQGGRDLRPLGAASGIFREPVVPALLLGSSLALGIGVSPAGAATVRPATATNCTIAGTNFGGVDQHYWGWKATCDDIPTSTWQLVVVCESYGGKVRGEPFVASRMLS